MVGVEVLELARQVTSPRVMEQITHLRHRLEAHRTVSEVQAFTHQHDADFNQGLSDATHP